MKKLTADKMRWISGGGPGDIEWLRIQNKILNAKKEKNLNGVIDALGDLSQKLQMRLIDRDNGIKVFNLAVKALLELGPVGGTRR